MAESNGEAGNLQPSEAEEPRKLTRREKRRAAKAQKKAQKAAAKQAKKDEKAARKLARKNPEAAAAAPAAPAVPTVPFQQPVSADAPADEPQGFVPAVAGSSYSQFAPSNIAVDPQQQEAAEANRKRRRRRTTVVAVLVTLLCLVGVGSAGAYLYLQQLNANLAGDEEEAQEVRESLVPAPVGDEPFYMLLVGCDDREGVDGARADTTILTRIDPGNNQVTLISIPRDTAVDIDGYGTQKFNAAYTYGGPSGTIDAASQLCGVQISHYAEVHFEALINIIDSIGGVDVDVPIPIDDVDAGGKLDAGLQHLNGEQAMIFARSRSYTNGDFQRTTSQRLLIEAAVDRVMNMLPSELPGLLMQVTQSMTTDLSVQELLGLALAFHDEPPLVMYSALVPSTTDNWDGVSYVVTDVALFAQMMEVVNQGGDPASVVPDDYTVTTSEEAQEQGIEVIVNTGDDTPDEGAYGYYDYGYYDYGYYGYGYADSTDYSDDAESDYSYGYDDDGTYADAYSETYDDGGAYADDSGYYYEEDEY